MIEFQMDKKITASEFKDLILRTKLHRQTNDMAKLERMLIHSDFLYTAWENDQVIGYVRGLTDYGDVVYIADLGVDVDHRYQGIGKQLLKLVDQKYGETMHLVLLASEYAQDYYAKVGFQKDDRGYIRNPRQLDPHDWTV